MSEGGEKYVVVKKAKLGILGKVGASLLEMFPANATADVEDMNKGGWAIFISLMKQLAFVIVLAIFWWQNTTKEVGKSFLSLTGNSTSQTCSSVANPLNSKFTGDRFGYWESQPAFTHAGGFYQLIFTGSEVDNTTYFSTMAAFQNDLKFVGDKCSKRDLAYSILALSAWSVDDKSVAMELTTNAGISHILANFDFIGAGFYVPDGPALNTAGDLGGGVGGFTSSLSQNGRQLQFSFPLSQCTPASQVKSITTSFRGNIKGSTRLLTVLPATATVSATTLNVSSSILEIGPVGGGGAVTNDMNVVWKDSGYDPNSVYVLQFCEDNTLTPPPSGSAPCALRPHLPQPMTM